MHAPWLPPPPGYPLPRAFARYFRTMQAGFYTIMAAQFFSSLADNALLVARQLVVANGWIEGTTVASIILGVLLGGILISGPVSSVLLAIDVPRIETGIDTPPQAAIAVIMGAYAIAGIFNWYIPDTGV